MITEQQAKSILRKRKRVDSWFISHYGMNLYRGCLHNCTYCDGRAEKYQVSGEFGRDISVKTNAQEILDRELDPARKRKPLKKSYVMLGGGVGDSYQEIEKNYQLSRKALNLLEKYKFPVHILTKSALVKRDIDILKKIHHDSGVIVSFSFSTVDERISTIFEPQVPSPTERLNTIKLIKSHNIPCGIFLMPVIPFISDTPQKIQESIIKAKEAGVDFILFGGMTLKEGRQKEYYMNVLAKHYPNLLEEYQLLYQKNPYGQADQNYYHQINQIFLSLARQYKISPRIPAALFKDILDITDLTLVILEQMDYILKSTGQKSPYGYAAYSIYKTGKTIPELKTRLRTLSGIGPVTEGIIKEIINTKSCKYYEKLMNL